MYGDGVSGWYGLIGVLIVLGVVALIVGTLGFMALQSCLRDEFKEPQ